MAKKASPLLQLDLKSLTLTEQPTLERDRRTTKTQSPVCLVATAKCQSVKTSIIALTLILYMVNNPPLALVPDPHKQGLLGGHSEASVER